MQGGASTYPAWHLNRSESLIAASVYLGSPGVCFHEPSVLDMYA
jgi:hypothetical protein